MTESPENKGIRGQKIEGFEAGQDFPETITFNGQEYLRSNKLDAGMVYGRRIKTDFPSLDELLIVDSQGIIVDHLLVDQKKVLQDRFKG